MRARSESAPPLDLGGIVPAVRSGGGAGGLGSRRLAQVARQRPPHHAEGAGIVRLQGGRVHPGEASGEARPERVVAAHQQGAGGSVGSSVGAGGVQHVDPVAQVPRVEVERLRGGERRG